MVVYTHPIYLRCELEDSMKKLYFILCTTMVMTCLNVHTLQAEAQATESLEFSTQANTPVYRLKKTAITPLNWYCTKINYLHICYPKDLFTEYRAIAKDDVELRGPGKIIKLLFEQEGLSYLEHKKMLQSNKFELRQITDESQVNAYRELLAQKVEWVNTLGENIYIMESSEFLAIIQGQGSRQLILLWDPSTNAKAQISVHSEDSQLAFNLLSGISFNNRKFRIQRSTRSSVPRL